MCPLWSPEPGKVPKYLLLGTHFGLRQMKWSKGGDRPARTLLVASRQNMKSHLGAAGTFMCVGRMWQPGRGGKGRVGMGRGARGTTCPHAGDTPVAVHGDSRHPRGVMDAGSV